MCEFDLWSGIVQKLLSQLNGDYSQVFINGVYADEILFYKTLVSNTNQMDLLVRILKYIRNYMITKKKPF